MNRTVRALLVLLVLAALVSGCAVEHSPPALHDLGVPLAVAVNPNSPPKPLIRVQAPPWYLDSIMRYRLLYHSPTTVRAYQLDSWIAPPADLLQHYLQAAGLQLTRPLTIRLVDFEQQFLSPGHAQVVLRFIAEYGDVQTPASVSREFDLTQTSQTADAAGAADAFAKIAKQAAERLKQWLARPF